MSSPPRPLPYDDLADAAHACRATSSRAGMATGNSCASCRAGDGGVERLEEISCKLGLRSFLHDGVRHVLPQAGSPPWPATGGRQTTARSGTFSRAPTPGMRPARCDFERAAESGALSTTDVTTAAWHSGRLPSAQPTVLRRPSGDVWTNLRHHSPPDATALASSPCGRP